MDKDNRIKMMKIEKQVLSKMLEKIINECEELKKKMNEHENFKKGKKYLGDILSNDMN